MMIIMKTAATTTSDREQATENIWVVTVVAYTELNKQYDNIKNILNENTAILIWFCLWWRFFLHKPITWIPIIKYTYHKVDCHVLHFVAEYSVNHSSSSMMDSRIFLFWFTSNIFNNYSITMEIL